MCKIRRETDILYFLQSENPLAKLETGSYTAIYIYHGLGNFWCWNIFVHLEMYENQTLKILHKGQKFYVILGNLKVLFTTTTTTASLPEFSLGATTHTRQTQIAPSWASKLKNDQAMA